MRNLPTPKEAVSATLPSRSEKRLGTGAAWETDHGSGLGHYARYRRHLVIRDPYPYIRYHEHARLYGGRDENRDRRGPPTQGAPGDDDNNSRGSDRGRARDGRPDARTPARGDAPSQQAQGQAGSGDSRDAGKQGGKGASPGGKDDDDEARDRRAPGLR